MTRPDNDTAIIRALRSGLTTSTEIAATIGLPVERTQNALNRLLDNGKVARSRTGSGYVWTVAT